MIAFDWQLWGSHDDCETESYGTAKEVWVNYDLF